MSCGENVGKGLTKSPSQTSERAIKVIRDYVAALRFPFLRGPSSKLKQIGILLRRCRFLCSVVAYESELSTFRRTTKKIAQPLVALFACTPSMGMF